MRQSDRIRYERNDPLLPMRKCKLGLRLAGFLTTKRRSDPIAPKTGFGANTPVPSPFLRSVRDDLRPSCRPRAVADEKGCSHNVSSLAIAIGPPQGAKAISRQLCNRHFKHRNPER